MKECRLCKKRLESGENHICPQKNGESILYNDSDFIIDIIDAAADVISNPFVGNIVSGIMGDLDLDILD
ncbi:hypothetical protein HY967_04820 [Candidatus Jorgensenbacteria bacterium]|nr:hypothetical protein [Candidatus Jorgensenbacteria bacterium]